MYYRAISRPWGPAAAVADFIVTVKFHPLTQYNRLGYWQAAWAARERLELVAHSSSSQPEAGPA